MDLEIHQAITQIFLVSVEHHDTLIHSCYFACSILHRAFLQGLLNTPVKWQINLSFLFQYSVFLMILATRGKKMNMIPGIFGKCKASFM